MKLELCFKRNGEKMNEEKIIMHLDMDAFFASCLQQKYPNLAHKPIVVAYNDRKSIVVTSSYEARKLGVKTAMPLYLAKKVSHHQIIRVDPEYDLFSDYSHQVFAFIKEEFTPLVEIASIDECYLDVTQQWKKYGTPRKMAIAIKTAIKKQLGLSCSIGISNTKFLAKMIGKEFKPNGIGTLNPLTLSTTLWLKPINQMYGIGPSLVKQMQKLGIHKIKDLVFSDDQFLNAHFGKYSLELKKRALGRSSNQVLIKHPDYKNISNDLTLSKIIYEEEEFLDILHQITLHVAKRAQKEKMVSKTVGLSVHYYWKNKNRENFDKAKHHSRKSRQTQIDHYTNDAEEIYAHLVQIALETIDFQKGVYLISVSLKDTININKVPYQHQITQTSNLQFNQLLSNSGLKRAKDIQAGQGKLREQTKYIQRENIHFNKHQKTT